MGGRSFQTSAEGLVYRPELASGIRLDGRFEGPKLDTSAIWKGRPPTLPDGTPYPSIVISASTGNGPPAPVGSTVTIQAECAAGNGGRVFREFQVGYGISAELMAGYYDHVVIRAVTPIPAGMNLYFVWSQEVFSSARLWNFMPYPVGGTAVNLPEGVEQIMVEDAGTITFQVPQFGTTFARAMLAGESINTIWSAMSYDVPTNFILRLKSV